VKINHDIDNIVFYQRINYKLKIPYIQGCIKKITKHEIHSSEPCKILKPQNLKSIVVNPANFANNYWIYQRMMALAGKFSSTLVERSRWRTSSLASVKWPAMRLSFTPWNRRSKWPTLPAPQLDWWSGAVPNTPLLVQIFKAKYYCTRPTQKCQNNTIMIEVNYSKNTNFYFPNFCVGSYMVIFCLKMSKLSM
jgi:hypothetical protein